MVPLSNSRPPEGVRIASATPRVKNTRWATRREDEQQAFERVVSKSDPKRPVLRILERCPSSRRPARGKHGASWYRAPGCVVRGEAAEEQATMLDASVLAHADLQSARFNWR